MIEAKLNNTEKQKGYTTYAFDITGLGDYFMAFADVDAAGKVIACSALSNDELREYKQCPQWLKDAVVEATKALRAKSNWGGVREGQGGKPKGEVAMTKTYYLRCTEELHAKLKEKGSDWVREILEWRLHEEDAQGL